MKAHPQPSAGALAGTAVPGTALAGTALTGTALAGTAQAGTAAGTRTGCEWLAPALQMAAVACGNWQVAPGSGAGGWARLPRAANRTPGTGPAAVRAGRDFAVATMRRWGAAGRQDDVAIAVSELLTNALVHALTDAVSSRVRPVRLGLLQLGRCVLCAVADPSSATPRRVEPGRLAGSGRGLLVIDSLADAWGYTPPGRDGKIVWALFCLRHDGEPAAGQRPALREHARRAAEAAIVSGVCRMSPHFTRTQGVSRD